MKGLGSVLLLCLLTAVALSAGSESEAVKSAKGMQEAFAEVAEAAFPSVVIVKVKMEPETVRTLPGCPFPVIPKDQPQKVGMGSGFVIREDGYILTNHHVAGAGGILYVILHDGRELPAKLVGTDWKTDLSVLKVDVKERFPALKFADTSKLKVGHWAMAVGAPFNFGYTVTSGIVSQKGRAVGVNQYENYIQTDASINPGNSGGPLLNLDGEVIGVNDFIIAGGGQGGVVGNTGMAFAIDGSLASGIAESIMHSGEVVRPWLGVSMQELDGALKKQFKAERGVLVRQVVSGDPADKAGIEPGDVILKVGAQSVHTPNDVRFALLKFNPGDNVPVAISRYGKEMLIEVVAGRQRDDRVAGVNPLQAPPPLASAKDSVIKSFGIALVEKDGGVAIESIDEGSAAALAGLKPGMRLYAVNRMKVSSLKGAEEAAEANPSGILLYIDDGDSKFFVSITR